MLHFHTKKVNRKQFLQQSARFGMALTAAAYPLANCKPSKKEEHLGLESASDPSTEQYKFLKDVGKTYKGTKLTIITEDTPPSKAIKQLAGKEFSKITGIEVDWKLETLDKVLVQINQDSLRKVATNDIYYWDQAWVGKFANDSIDPRKLLENKDIAYPNYRFNDVLPTLVESTATYKGRLVGIPYDIPIFILMYRKDIFDKLGLSVPRTIREYLDVAQIITKEMAPKVYGTTAQWRPGHYSLECSMTSWLWAHGGSIFKQNEESAINDEKGFVAMEYMLRLIQCMPPEAIQYDWYDEAKSFWEGRAAMYISWGEYFPVFDNPKISKVVGLAETSPCPKEISLRQKSECSFDETPGISHQGGSCLAISKYSKNVEAAWLFLQWATSADITVQASLLAGGASPIRKSTFYDPRIQANDKVMEGTTRHFKVTLDAIMNRMGTEPHLPSWSELANNSFAIELGKMVSGLQGIKTTLDNMANDTRKAARSVK
ncbi:MAG: extracellular solute-binding protein [Leptospiraceae bacterium]|nr:extracellular solute-binding protein [Leptospiraceae bacterium]